MRTVLIIAPYFPPLARVGALRPLKLVRYLVEFGWRPVVLSMAGGSGALDFNLSERVPDDVVVDRSYAAGPLWWIEKRATAPATPKLDGRAGKRGAVGKIRDRMREHIDDWTFVDGRLPHSPNAVARAVALARRYDAKVIFACGDPWSGLVTAAVAARIASLPFVADLRDPWTLEPERFEAKSPLIKVLERRVERAVFTRASRVILNTEAALSAYRQAYSDLPRNQFTHQRNCFDPGLFVQPDGEASREDDLFSMVYFGRFRRFRTMEDVSRILRVILRNDPVLASRLRLDVVGGVEGEDLDRMNELESIVRVVDRVPYERSLDVLSRADLLLLTLAGTAGLQLPAKLYDYLAAGRPTLGIADSEELSRILADTGMGKCFAPGDTRAAADFVADVASGRFTTQVEESTLEPFTARAMARKIASILAAVSR